MNDRSTIENLEGKGRGGGSSLYMRNMPHKFLKSIVFYGLHHAYVNMSSQSSTELQHLCLKYDNELKTHEFGDKETGI